jgi:hypothetical protein
MTERFVALVVVGAPVSHVREQLDDAELWVLGCIAELKQAATDECTSWW